MGASSWCCFCIANAEESPCTQNDGVAGLGMRGAEGASTYAEMATPPAETEPSANPVCRGLNEMNANSSSGFDTAKAEEFSSTAVDGVAELTMVGAEGASTSRRGDYYSARCEAMMRSRGQFSDDVAMEIEFSKSHCSEVSRLEVAPKSAEEERINRENKKVLNDLRKVYPRLFSHEVSRLDLGRMIAKGGQAEVYEVVGESDYLMKVFERGTSLRDLQQLWPLPVLKESVRHCIVSAGMLKDDRFVFLMERCWGDLRKLIDQAMLEKKLNGIQGPPLPYKWKDYNKWTFHPLDFMLGIAEHMQELHGVNVSHRDLKTSNILLQRNFGMKQNLYYQRAKGIVVADFECSIGVLGTGFWRAPEILATLGNASTITNEQWKQADVYSYGMVCFEILTGRIPFDGELENTKADRQLVIEGKRPQLPSDLDDALKDLILKCWETNPRLRPTFLQIVDVLKTISTRQFHCQFRLFHIVDELPPQYRLATIQDVDEYPVAVMKVMPEWEIANLANGCVHGYAYGMQISLEPRNDEYVGQKLARIHH